MVNTSGEIWEWLKSILIAVLLAFLIRFFFIDVFLVEGSSMYPTLKDNERLIVNKLSYRFNEPKRGDIIVFNYSAQRVFIKRIIATGGDTVEISNRRLYIDGELYEEEYISSEPIFDYGPEVVPQEHVFVLGDNRSNSMDSRDPSVGFIPNEHIKGRAFFVFWPLSEMKVLGARQEGISSNGVVVSGADG